MNGIRICGRTVEKLIPMLVAFVFAIGLAAFAPKAYAADDLQAGAIDDGMGAQSSSYSNYALLASDGYLYPCNSSGVKTSDYWTKEPLATYWQGGNTEAENAITEVTTLFIASDVTDVWERWNIWVKGQYSDKGTVKDTEKELTGGVNPLRIYKYMPKIERVVFQTNANGKSSVEKLREGLFYGLSQLSSVEGLDKTQVRVIPTRCFWECTHLQSIKLPDTCNSIEGAAFFCCTNLKSIDFGKGLKSLGGDAGNTGFGAFRACTSLTSLEFPASFTTLAQGTCTFQDCENLRTVVFNREIDCVTLGYYDFFKNTPIYDENSDGYIYVANSLLPQYQANSVSNTWNGYQNKIKGKLNIDPVADVTYDGKAKTPTPTVRWVRTALPSSAYTLSYANNVNVGTATVTATGKGGYAGNTASTTFAIKAAPNNNGNNNGGNNSGNNNGNANNDQPHAGKSGPTQWRRLYGDYALDTMRAIVREGFTASGGTVVVATFDGYWDALAAAGLAGLTGAPVLMTDGSALSPQTQSELERLAPSQVFVCGGPAAVSERTCSQIAAVCGVEPMRIAGDNAVDTAVQIDVTAPGATGGKWSGEAFLCTSDGYWDALAAAPVAYALHMPIFLTEADGTLSASTLEAIRACGITKVHIAGGTAAVSESAEAMLGDLMGVRFAGDFAIQTSEAIARFGLSRNMTADNMGVATTGGYWDALAGAALCGKKSSVLVLVGDASSSSIDGFVRENSLSEVSAYVFGGPAAVGNDVLAALESATAGY